MNLSSHFTLGQLCVADKQRLTRLGLRDNWPGKAEEDCLRRLCESLLEPIYAKFPTLTINSGFRSIAYNRGIGGSKTSQHCLGEAADIEATGVANAALFAWIALESGIKWGQLILEYPGSNPTDGWVHVSLPSKTNQGEMMQFDGKRYERFTPATVRKLYGNA